MNASVHVHILVSTVFIFKFSSHIMIGTFNKITFLKQKQKNAGNEVNTKILNLRIQMN